MPLECLKSFLGHLGHWFNSVLSPKFINEFNFTMTLVWKFGGSPMAYCIQAPCFLTMPLLVTQNSYVIFCASLKSPLLLLVSMFLVPSLADGWIAQHLDSCHLCWIKKDLLTKLTVLHLCTCPFQFFFPSIDIRLFNLDFLPPYITLFPEISALINTSYYYWPLERKKHSMRPIIRAEKHSQKLARVICVSCQFH